MDYLQIQGPTRLEGSVSISGAKNAALPLIAMTILAKNSVTIGNMPEVVDIKTLLKLLQNLGGTFTLENNSVTVNTAVWAGCRRSHLRIHSQAVVRRASTGSLFRNRLISAASSLTV